MNNNNGFINESAQWNDTTLPFIKIEPNDDDYDDPPENITINELKLKNEFNDSVILSTENIIIKEEINIDEIVLDESTTNTQNWENEPQEIDPLSVTPEKFECKICAECFTQSRQLNNHLFIIHRPLTEIGTGAYCNKCSKWFPEIKYPNHNPCFKYMRSIQNGKRMHSCEICDKDYSALSLLKIHLLECHRPLIVHENLDLSEAILKQIVCNICGAVFPLKTALIHHLTLMHRPYTITGNGAYCTRCQTWFAEENFKDHRPCVAPVQSVVPVFNCNICCAEFKMLHLLKTHLYVIHRPLALQYCSDAFCDKCNRWFKEDNYTMHKCFRQLTTNIKMCNKYGFRCTVCSKVFESDDEIKKHLYNVHRPVVTDEWDKVFCDFCKKCFDEDKFEEHVPCHSVDGKCVFCLIMMPSKEHYLLHDLTWKRWRSYQCNMCNLNTQEMRLANLNEHMINHGKKSIFSCVKCKFDFASTENAGAHIECFHLGCRCIMLPCICDTYNYDYYYEFVKQRNISDFRGNNKNLLENEISIIREKQYKSVEPNIEVSHMKFEANILENSELNKFDFQVDCNNFQAIEVMPSTSTSTSTPTPMIMEDFSIPPGTSKIDDDRQFHVNYPPQEIIPKTEYMYDNEDPDEKRKRLNREKQRRWREKQRKEKSQIQKRNTIFLREEIVPGETISIEDDESSQEINYNLLVLEDPIERKKRLNREKQQRWRQRKSKAQDQIWEEKIEKQFQQKQDVNIQETMVTYIPEAHQNQEDPLLRKKRLCRERQLKWRNKKNGETLEGLQKTEEESHQTEIQFQGRKPTNQIPGQKTLENSGRQTKSRKISARRTEQLQSSSCKIPKDTPEEIKAKRRRTIQSDNTINNQQQSSPQSENNLDKFFEMIMDRWT